MKFERNCQRRRAISLLVTPAMDYDCTFGDSRVCRERERERKWRNAMRVGLREKRREEKEKKKRFQRIRDGSKSRGLGSTCVGRFIYPGGRSTVSEWINQFCGDTWVDVIGWFVGGR